MMLSSSAVDRALGTQTGNHDETHHAWTPGVRPPRMRLWDFARARKLEGQRHRRPGWREVERGIAIHRSVTIPPRRPRFGKTQRRTLVSPRVITAAAIACITTSTAISAFDTPSTVGM